MFYLYYYEFTLKQPVNFLFSVFYPLLITFKDKDLSRYILTVYKLFPIILRIGILIAILISKTNDRREGQ